MTESAGVARARESRPLYRLAGDESGEVLLVAEELDGFFVPPAQDESELVVFRGVPGEAPSGDVDDVALDVLDFRGERMGSYYIGRVRFGRSVPGVRGDGSADLEASFHGYTCPYPRAGEIWRRWASGRPVESGEWAGYPAEAHGSWLHVVQTAWFGSGRAATRYEAAPAVVIDGLELPGTDSFYCALGEASNGPGGYIGSNLDALEDCLRSGQVHNPLRRLTWRNFRTSREAFGEEYTAGILDVLRDHGVRVELR